MRYVIQPGGKLVGDVEVPGDKSISHRAVMLGALAKGVTTVHHFLASEDALATLTIFRALGVEIEGPHNHLVKIQGVGLYGLRAPRTVLDCGNSGTSMRLLAGILAAQPFDSVLTGDDSLLKRPMRRVVDPLYGMGAKIIPHKNGTAPLTILGNQVLKGFEYRMPLASAQVKSCLLLAGLYAEGKTTLIEPAVTRDHTEKMLQQFQYKIEQKDNVISIEGRGELKATTLHVPGDISSAAFLMVGATITPGSEILLKRVGVNPTRTGILTLLRMMGGQIELENQQERGGEPVADIRVKYAPHLQGISIPVEQVPLAIDEFPILFIAAACAKGKTLLRNAKELRVKESDRIQVMAEGLKSLGIHVEVQEDGMSIEGGKIKGGAIDSYGDHRIAMSFAMAALRASEEIIIKDVENVATSFPGFDQLAKRLGLKIEKEV